MISHTRSLVLSSPTTERVRGGDPSARPVRRNHFSRHHGYRDGKEAKSSPSRPRSLTTSARRITSEGQQGCGPTGRTARILAPIASPTASLKGAQRMTPSYPTATRTRSQGMVFLFRWPCYQIQADTPVDVWSNHACQAALFFPSISTACSSRSVRSCPASELLAQVGGSVNTRSSPASRKCTPRQRYVNQQAASWSKVGQ